MSPQARRPKDRRADSRGRPGDTRSRRDRDRRDGGGQEWPHRLSRPWLLVIFIVIVAGLAGSLVLIKSQRGSRSITAYCDKMRAARDLDVALAGLDPDALRPSYEALASAVDVAPGDIEPELSVLTELARELVYAIESSPTNPSAAASQVLASHDGEIDRITAAGEAVETYTRDNCDFELG